jgi:hypothetical protein
MRSIRFIGVLLLLAASFVLPQTRQSQTHIRSMLHQTVYNTGELGRAFDRGDAGMSAGFSSLEWPSNSAQTLDRNIYKGQHNSYGGGLYISGFRKGEKTAVTIPCGGVTNSTGAAMQIAGVYCTPGSITRTENYPVLADGQLNPAYNPNEAEETIVANWTTIGLNISVTRTSRAWSFPGYNSFIIYEYDMVNNDTVDINDAFVGWDYGLSPSMFGYERVYNRWAEGDLRSKDMYARYDLSRWMTYNHDRNGKPEGDESLFNTWSSTNNRGSLNSPQAVGILPLHIEYDHLAVKGQTNYPKGSDSNYVWDEHNKLKQPYTNRYENANVYIDKVQSWTDITARKTTPFNGATDSTAYVTKYRNDAASWAYWKGRAKPSWSLGWKQPGSHGYVFGPYAWPKGEHLHFSIAEVVGYGPGDAGDSVYSDLGGGSGTEASLGFHPIPSWYHQMTYADAGGTPPVIGSDYLQTHNLPWYVTPGVVSIRDVADRAIQMYTGNPLVKWDSLQFDPTTTPAAGAYNSVVIPVPAPVLTIYNTGAAVNRLMWGAEVESFSSLRLQAPFSHYVLYRSLTSLGPWALIDSVGKEDPRYWRDSAYVVDDRKSKLGEDVWYILYSVDQLGNKNGLASFTAHNTQAPAALTLGKVYVIPNPLVVTNGTSSGVSQTTTGEDVGDKIRFVGLTKHCTIRIYSYSGQLINTMYHTADEFSRNYYQLSRSGQMIASGVYFFVVQDEDTGTKVTGKFVVIH